MSVAMEEPDPFIEWCHDKGIAPEAQQAAFAEYVLETTGFDGMQFSLTEAERAWITRANEVIEWLRLVGPRGDNAPALEAALRCVASLKPMPSSLSID